ncbi:sodium/proline symporter [Penicillium chermesinum]|uniref:Sodium/proline symporter n=1 Tax=Penicillium chermesinum TaxID=63820 RepID=A0A9W9PJR3_9EURO|nr:sodium/proline symporter [Penicillium chermesinum]KAJ5248716.1 sodium/proline symporter [Penicillium chermesinum]
MSDTNIPASLEGVGYGIVIGVGAIFAIGMSLTSWLLSRYMNEVQDSEMFMTAKHSVKSGLTASAVVSSWTIATTLLTSTTYGYQYGVAGPFWYAAAACVQILLFSVAAVELKRKAPNAQTFLQVVKLRYGTSVHLLYTAYSGVYQIINTVNLLVGGSAVFSSMSGVNRDAICYLFPVGVIIYTLMGGIKATFITDWVHTVMIYVIMLISLFVFYTTSSVAGSPSRVWELLKEASSLHPVDGNADGQYLTMRSQEGGYVGLVFIGAGFAACVDSQLFQKAIASDPRTTSVGYIIGGLSWFTIPFVLASTYGLAAAALEHLPSWPTYPNRMNDYEISSGLAMPYAAYALMGDGGVVAVLLMIFMAVTSAMSSETVATTALVTYNIYQAYIKPNASGRSLLYFSHFVTVGFAIFCSSIAVAFNHGGFSVGFLITAIGIFVDAAIPFSLPSWARLRGVLAWFLTTHSLYDVISVATLSENLPLVAGNIVALGSPLVLTPLLTFLRPEDFDWQIFKDGIKRGDDEQIQVPVDDESNKDPTRRTAREMHEEQEDEATLISARNRSIYLSIFLTLSLVILWPIPMYGTSYIFSSGFFTGWVAFLFIWAFLAAGIIVLLPIWEGKMQVYVLLKKVFGSPEELDSEPVTTLTLGELEDMTTSTTEKPPVDSAKAVV